MSLSIAAYRQAGDYIEDADVSDNANIETAKLGTRTLYRSLPATIFQRSGTGVSLTTSGVFGGVTLPDANAGSLFASFPLPDEYVSGAITIRIFWNTTATSGAAKFFADVKSTSQDGSLTSEETDSVVDTANGTASRINDATIDLDAADFTAGDIIGLKIYRDPSDGSDTLGADLVVFEVTLEFTGRG